MRQSVVFLAAVWILLGVAVFAAEPLSRESAEEFLERLRVAKAEFENSAPKGNGVAEIQKGDGVAGTADTLNRATVFMGDSYSKGSGFFAKLWGEPVILTSAHTFVLMKNPKIVNANSDEFKIHAAVIHKDLDLAILEPEPGSVPKDMLFFKITPKLSMKEIDSTTEESCDISGEQKLGKREGKLLHIRKDRITIEYTIDPSKKDPPVVAGNSGGPILNKNGSVIGLSTYWKVPSIREIFAGTRFFHLVKDGNDNQGQGITIQWTEERNTGEIESVAHYQDEKKYVDGTVRVQDYTFFNYKYITIYKFRCSVPRVDRIDLEKFELFDKISQEKDLAFYKTYETVMQRCINEIRNPHYNWDAAWPYIRWQVDSEGHLSQLDILEKKPLTDYSDISNYLYCYNDFHKMDFDAFFHYHASLSRLQNLLNFQRSVYAQLSCLLHVLPVQLQNTEISSAGKIFEQLEKDRKDHFTCPQCGGSKIIRIAKLRGSVIRTCPYCEGNGRYAVPYYGPWRVSPLQPFPQSKWKISGFRLGMSLSEANKVVNETWRTDTEEYNLIDLNGIFDLVRVGRNPEFGERALRTELKFIARRLYSMTVTFENDQHNFPRLKEMLNKTFGEPYLSREHSSDWKFLMFVKDDIVVTLSVAYNKVFLRASHRVLQHVEYLVLNTLEQKLFGPPLKFADAEGHMKLDNKSYIKTLKFFP